CRPKGPTHTAKFQRLIMALPPPFGATWEDFLATWCLGNAPILDPQTVDVALAALVRLWPERVAEISQGSTRGLTVVSPAIQNGLVRAPCEGWEGCGNVLPLLRPGELSAHAD